MNNFNVPTFIVQVLVIVAVAAIVVREFRRRKRGESSCGGGCANCPMCGMCSEKEGAGGTKVEFAAVEMIREDGA